MQGSRSGLFSSFKQKKNKRTFFTMRISVMVPPCGPADTSRAFRQRIARPLLGQEHAPTETSRPLSPGLDPCGRLQCFGDARPWSRATRASRGHSRRALLALGSSGLHVFLCLRPIFQNCRHHETHSLGHSRHHSTVRNYTSYHGHQQLHLSSPPPPRPQSHIGTSIIPSPTTMGADLEGACFFWRYFAIHIPKEDHLAPGSLWVHPMRWDGKKVSACHCECAEPKRA